MRRECPPIAIVTTCRNYGRWLLDCIHSVRQQTFGDFEHVIVDDASRDNTRPIVWEAIREDERVDLIPLSSQHGHAAALNIGWGFTTSPFVLKLDADDTIEPTYLAEIMAAVREDPRRNVLFSWCHLFGDEDRIYSYPPFDPTTLATRHQIPGPAAIARSLYQAVGGFRDLPCGEDWDFYVRAHRAVGLVPYQIPAPLWNYRQHSHPDRMTRVNQEHLPRLQAEWAALLAAPPALPAAG